MEDDVGAICTLIGEHMHALSNGLGSIATSEQLTLRQITLYVDLHCVIDFSLILQYLEKIEELASGLV